MRKIVSLFCVFIVSISAVLAQTKTITGKITDENKNPIAGASILVKGTKTGITTNQDGSFTIKVPTSAKQLVISYVGFEKITVNIDASNTLSVALKPSAAELSDVVVTGYTRVKKSQYVGAASKIDKKAIELVPTASFDQILQGRAPGLRVSAGSGQPGAAANVQIRGPKSIAGGSTPLYVVDGVPVEASVFQGLNPNDFESVDILKDASSAALYGSRGASGVIVITTKRGQKGTTKLTYRPQFGITEAGAQPFNMMNSRELLGFQEKLGMQLNDISLPGWVFSRKNPANAGESEETLSLYDNILDSLGGINTNWADVFQRRGGFQAHDLSISGGNDKTRFFISGSYYNEQGIGLRSDLKRYTVRANIDHTTDKLTLQYNSTAGYSIRNIIESENGIALANPFAAAYLALPYDPLFLADGSVNTGADVYGPKTGGNAYQRILDIKRYNNQFKLTNSLSLNYDFTKNIFAGGNAGFDFRETQNTTFLQPGSFTAIGGNGQGPQDFPGNTGTYVEGLSRFFQANFRGYIGYKISLGRNQQHNFTVTANAENIFRKTKSFSLQGFGLNEKLPNTPAAITPGTVDNRLIPSVGGSKSERAYLSYFGMLKYQFSNRYVVDFSVRRDGASVLPAANRFQNFYAVGFLWNTLNESFAKNWTTFSTLRVRASYGSSANAENFPFGDFGYLPLYNAGSYAGLQTLRPNPNSPGNAAGTWEFTDKANLGIEFGLWNERLFGEISIYDEVTKNLFIDQGLPIENGSTFFSASVNAGKLRNRGVELNLSYDVIRKKNLTWTLSGNFAYNKNEVLSLGQVKEIVPPNTNTIVKVGSSLGTHYINRWAGVDAASGAPLYYTKDGGITNVYSSADLVTGFGTSIAPWNGGFSSTLKFFNFDISAFFNFQYGGQRFNNQDFFQLNHAFAIQGFNLRKEMLNMWTNPGQITNYQSPLYQRQFSSKDIQDASYLRFRNLQIGYTVPASLFRNNKVVRGARFYVQAQNLYTFTNWKGFDPEDDDGVAQYEYPLPRTYTFGLNVEF